MTYTGTENFERAIFDLPFMNYCTGKKIELTRFNALAQHSGDWLLETLTSSAVDIVIVPVSEKAKVNFLLRPEEIKKKVVYIVTGDATWADEIDQIPGSIVVTFNSKQSAAFNNAKVIQLFPFVNEYAFFPTKDNKRKNIDVAFFGSHTDEREKCIIRLLKSRISVNVYGSGWDEVASKSARGNKGHFYPRNNLSFQRNVLNRANIGLVIDDAIKPIHFEIPTCGSMLMAKYADDVADKFLKGKDMIAELYSSEEELADRIKFYLANKRERGKLQRKVTTLVKKKYTSVNFFDAMFKELENENGIHNP